MFEVPQSLKQLLSRFSSRTDPRFHSLRWVREDALDLSVTRNVIEPARRSQSTGAMVCARIDGNEAFAATSDLTPAGLDLAFEHACDLALALGSHALLQLPPLTGPASHTHYRSPDLAQALPDAAHWLELLAAQSAKVPHDERLVHWAARLRISERQQLYVDRTGSEVLSQQRRLYPELEVTAFDGQQSQRRTFAVGQQGSAELLNASGFLNKAPEVADQALQLLLAPNTPQGTRDLLLMPDQMILQIHESIGHPLELDRILGDERNYAGTSFVSQDMFGHYQYGSELLNVSFDPSVPSELASYSHDDEGTPAEKHLLIAKGILQRPLGGALSQARSGMPGVANSRACDWNRPPIDRMANLNVEPGDQTLQQMIGNIEHGILMATNKSWSIDQARNKFQFGCEWGQLIENGELAGVVKNPNYRGISSQFWRNLSAVGNASTFEVMGTANCGKGEPNQAITVGHATPPCVFNNIAVFGGASLMNHAHFSNAFAAIEQWVSAQLREGEQFSLWFAAEDSQFIRFNHGQVRQASHVRQIDVTLRLIRDERHASQHLNVSGVIEHDAPALAEGLAQLRALLDVLPADPYLELNNQAWHSDREACAELPQAAELIEQVARLSEGLDMVGIYAGGPMYRGFASSWGARGWHQAGSASLDFSLFQANGEAVKSTYAASLWDSAQLAQQFAQAREQLLHLDKPRKELPPGQYRAYLAPAAVEEIIGMLNWDGFSARALATRQSSLQALQLKLSSLSPQVNLSEMASTGLEPAFNTEGGLRQDQALLAHGQLVGQMVSTRSAREYGLTDNGASHYEHAASLEMAAGNLPSDQVLAALGTGLYIGNLWYLNYSDMGSARMTGMTRFASFWVEDGKIVAPLATMRFDDSLYHMFGDNLIALTRERTLSISTSTYGQRSAQTVLLPGALIDRFTLTL